MAKNKFYAVKIGRKPGIYSNWSDAEVQIKGFSGAKYKSFSNKAEATEFLGLSETEVKVNKMEIECSALPVTCNTVEIYCAGAVASSPGTVGAGYIVVANTNEIVGKGGCTAPDKYNAYSIYGDGIAAIKALDWCIARGIRNVSVCCNETIAKWACGNNKATSKVGQQFILALAKRSSKLNISFRNELFNKKFKSISLNLAREYANR